MAQINFNSITKTLSLLCLLGFSIIALVSSETTREDSADEKMSSNLVIGDKNWNDMLKGEWMIKFYAPWCPACRAMEHSWEEFAAWAKANTDRPVKVGSIDVTNQPALNGRFMITALPTIYHVINGEFRQYTLSRTLVDFKTFITDDGWKEINPVSSWTSPTSLMMSTISKLFSFSMELKNYHNALNSDYGFPTWLSMLLFGLLIITIGLLLGMCLVLASDYIWGPPQDYDEEVVVQSSNDDAQNKSSSASENELEVEVGDSLILEENNEDKANLVSNEHVQKNEDTVATDAQDDTSLRHRNVKTGIEPE